MQRVVSLVLLNFWDPPHFLKSFFAQQSQQQQHRKRMNSIVSSSFLDSENHEGRRILASNDGSYDHMSHFKDILYTLIFFTVVFFIGKVCGKIGLPALVRMKEKGRRKGERKKEMYME